MYSFLLLWSLFRNNTIENNLYNFKVIKLYYIIL